MRNKTINLTKTINLWFADSKGTSHFVRYGSARAGPVGVGTDFQMGSRGAKMGIAEKPVKAMKSAAREASLFEVDVADLPGYVAAISRSQAIVV
ncbi:MAG: hypothetical protein KAY13_05870 [Zoogloea sp.]|nr:hypothetical protein [Zoogloea sp.]